MSGAEYAPHPHISGRTAALQALAAWRMEWPGTPRVTLLTGSPGSGVTRLVTGFLMLCDPEYRERLPLNELDPTIVPPDLPAPAVPSPQGLTSAQVAWVLADHFGLKASCTQEIYAGLAAFEEPVTIVVPDVDRAGAVRGCGEPEKLVREVLRPLAATKTVRLLADVPRDLAAEVGRGLPPGTVRVIDLDEQAWADPEGLVLQAEAALRPGSGALRLPFTEDPQARRQLAEAIARRAGGSRLTAQLAVRGILTHPDGFDPADESCLPRSPGEAVDLHAGRLGGDPAQLRQLLAPLALAEGEGLPIRLWAPLASAIAGTDLSQAIADATPVLAEPFIERVEQDADRTLLRLAHSGLAEEIRRGLPDVRAAQEQIAVSLLDAVPDQDWSRADPYVRDYIAGHALQAGLLPQLLTDPGLFVHADPVTLRAAVEAAPDGTLGAPALTYRRTAPLLTRVQPSEQLRAALLETAFVEDGLQEYADATHQRVPALPWRTLWSVPVPAGVSAVTVGALPTGEPVAVLVVPEGTAGARAAGGAGALVYGLADGAPYEADPAAVKRPSQEQRDAAPLTLSRDGDHVRVWDRATEELVTALVSDTPFAGADLSPDGILALATERGAKAIRILAPAPAAGPTASASTPPSAEEQHS